MTASASSRPFEGEPDIMCITQFLLDTYQMTGWLENWEPRRWIGNIYHRDEDEMRAHIANDLPNEVRIWEQDGQIIGVMILDSPGSAFFQIHPHHRHIEPEMLAWAESALAIPTDDGKRKLLLWCYEDDAPRQSMLEAAGYTRGEFHENIRRCDLQNTDIPDTPVPEGFAVRSMGSTPDEWEQYATMLNRAFNRTFHKAADYANFQTCPIYDPDLDMVVTNPAGEIVCTAGLTHTLFGLVEPVCTIPEYEGKGLAKAAIAEGLRRLKARGVAFAFIGAAGNNPVSNHVYNKMGFTDFRRNYVWYKTF